MHPQETPVLANLLSTPSPCSRRCPLSVMHDVITTSHLFLGTNSLQMVLSCQCAGGVRVFTMEAGAPHTGTQESDLDKIPVRRTKLPVTR